MNHQSQNHLYQPMDAIKIFSSVTGITIHSIVRTDNCTPPVLCDNCINTVNKLLSFPHSSFFCNCYIFPCGAFHIFTNSVFDSTVYFISEPIVCELSNIKSCTIQNKKSLKCLQPDKLFDAAKLLYLLANCSFEPFYDKLPYQKIKNSLTEAVVLGDSARILLVVDDALNEILAETGLDFIKTKAACLKILFLLQEIAAEQIEPLLGEKDHNFSLIAFAEADTLGKLKLCLLSACEDFVQALNRTAGLKKNMVINRAIGLIQKDFKDRITQNSVANAVYLSPSYFSKLFKEVTGYNFSEYLNMVRIEKAKEMLEKTPLSIDEVYQKVGFENRSYFGKVFRKLTDMTPKQYKDACK